MKLVYGKNYKLRCLEELICLKSLSRWGSQREVVSVVIEWILGLLIYMLNQVRLCNAMDCNLPGFSIHGIFQARVLE